MNGSPMFYHNYKKLADAIILATVTDALDAKTEKEFEENKKMLHSEWQHFLGKSILNNDNLADKGYEFLSKATEGDKKAAKERLIAIKKEYLKGPAASGGRRADKKHRGDDSPIW